jgi:hypothetical protein
MEQYVSDPNYLMPLLKCSPFTKQNLVHCKSITRFVFKSTLELSSNVTKALLILCKRPTVFLSTLLISFLW